MMNKKAPVIVVALSIVAVVFVVAFVVDYALLYSYIHQGLGASPVPPIASMPGQATTSGMH